MAIDPKLLEILACPACKTEVHLTQAGNALRCDRCTRVYRIEDDIPIMLIEEATFDPPRASTGS